MPCSCRRPPLPCPMPRHRSSTKGCTCACPLDQLLPAVLAITCLIHAGSLFASQAHQPPRPRFCPCPQSWLIWRCRVPWQGRRRFRQRGSPAPFSSLLLQRGNNGLVAGAGACNTHDYDRHVLYSRSPTLLTHPVFAHVSHFCPVTQGAAFVLCMATVICVDLCSVGAHHGMWRGYGVQGSCGAK